MPEIQASPDARRKVCAELWTSFAALIRSYVAAYDLARPVTEHARVEQAGTGALTIERGCRKMRLDFDAAQGTGTWMLDENQPGGDRSEGGFEIGEDSRVAMSDRAGRMELEVAAEILTARIFEE